LLKFLIAEAKEDHLPTANDVAKVFGIAEERNIVELDSTPDPTERETPDPRVEADTKTTVLVATSSEVKVEQSKPSTSLPKPTSAEAIASIPDDDVIVYDVSESRISRTATPSGPLKATMTVPEPLPQPAVTMESLTFSFEKSATIVPREKPFSGKRTPKKPSKQSRKGKEPVRFGAFGAALEEQRLNAMVDSSHRVSDKRYDSDIEWGSDSDELDGTPEEDDMLDPDVDQDGFGGFLKSIREMNGSNQVTIDDLDDIALLQQEDDNSESASSDEEGSDPSGDDDVDRPGSSFQARLARLRKASRKLGDPNAPSGGGNDYDEDADLIDEIEVSSSLR
jgi:hypothetical protein